MSRSHLDCTRSICAGFLGLALIPAAFQTADAHLSIIRKGIEAAGDRTFFQRYGGALAAGDFNGDGVEDLASGAPFASDSGVERAGAVVVSWGSEHGLTHVGSTVHVATEFGVSTTEEAQFGYALAAADLNRNGFDDLIVAAPWEDVNGRADAGRIYFFLGSEDGLVPGPSFVQEDFGGVSLSDELFGAALLIDYLNNDIHQDLVVSSPGNTAERGGQIFIVDGTDFGPFGETRIIGPGSLGFSSQADRFGWALASGNLAGNTARELVVGAPRRTVGIDSYAGACFVLRGTAEGPSTSSAIYLDAGMTDEATPEAAFGMSLAVGSFFGPGVFETLVIGEPRAEVNGFEWAGRFHTIRGAEPGPDLSRTSVHDQSMYQGSNYWSDQFGLVLASGKFGGDTLSDDLFVGTPLDFGFDTNHEDSGSWLLLFGGPSGPGSHGYYTHFGQELLGDRTEERDELGSAGVIGDFDGSGRGNLAVSAAREGMVHIVAPWRQPQDYHCHSALAVDCDGDFIFSQKLFDELPMANASIIMAALIACERTQLSPSDPKYVSANHPVIVPEWAAELSPGHNYLEEGETIRYVDLIRVALMELGGDAVLTLADFLYPGEESGAQTLLKAEMNERAAQLGMLNTYFDRPCVFNAWEDPDDAEDHYTSAYDLYLLSKAAQENPLFSEYANLVQVQIQRQLPDEQPSLWYLDNWFLAAMRNSISSANGLKRGWTEGAGMATAFSASHQGENAYVATLGTPHGGGYGRTGIDLMNLALGSCAQLAQHTINPYRNGRSYHLHEPGLVSNGQTYGFSGAFTTLSGDVDVDIFPVPDGQAPETRGAAKLQRTSSHRLIPGTEAVLGIAPMETDLGTRVTNVSDGRIVIQVGGSNYVIPEGGSVVLPPKEDVGRWEIATATNTVADVLIEECYAFDFYHEFGGTPPGHPAFTARMIRETETGEDRFSFSIEWQSDGGRFAMGVRDADVVPRLPWDATREHATGRAPGFVEGSDAAVSIHTLPNPFVDQVRFAIQVPTDGGVGFDAPEVRIFDASGRNLQRLTARSSREAGAYDAVWDGRTAAGHRVSPGIYFYQVRRGSQILLDGRVVRMR